MNAPETTITSVIGPYEGRRISGSSKDITHVQIARRYQFEGFEVTIRGIPARRDNVTGALYISARDMKRLNRMVDEIVDAIRRQRTRATGRSIIPRVPLKFYRDFPVAA